MEVKIMNDSNGKIMKSYQLDDPSPFIELIRKAGGLQYRNCTDRLVKPNFYFYRYLGCDFFVDIDDVECEQYVMIYVCKE
ncbi:hypothetical protein [Alkalihalobacillus sp. LMS39]|uniref:hypothetical protein n=1 Tax=Alkalihalobacillus sp. LMS39 TaxID=2924032 RepID=UPI001FB4E11D|nr:hypothetical protein [Alkalihalobacillus sp. LMS39]UOE93542.1 hypothetical protein MM271_20510 [Alkalihalobacillus sp. LMS39]